MLAGGASGTSPWRCIQWWAMQPAAPTCITCALVVPFAAWLMQLHLRGVCSVVSAPQGEMPEAPWLIWHCMAPTHLSATRCSMCMCSNMLHRPLYLHRLPMYHLQVYSVVAQLASTCYNCPVGFVWAPSQAGQLSLTKHRLYMYCIAFVRIFHMKGLAPFCARARRCGDLWQWQEHGAANVVCIPTHPGSTAVQVAISKSLHGRDGCKAGATGVPCGCVARTRVAAPGRGTG